MLPTTRLTRGVPNPRYTKFAERLYRSRRAAGLHAVALSEKAGLSGPVVPRLEAGPGLPKLPTLELLARALQLSPGWLAYGLGEPGAPSAGGPLLSNGLADRAREMRAALGISLREVARRSLVADAAVRGVERGAMPAIDTLEKLATALGVSPAWLAYGLGPRELPRRGQKNKEPGERNVREHDADLSPHSRKTQRTTPINDCPSGCQQVPGIPPVLETDVRHGQGSA